MYHLRILALAAIVTPLVFASSNIPITTPERRRFAAGPYWHAGKVDLTDAVSLDIDLLMTIIQNSVKQQQQAREAFTKGLVQEFRHKYPQKNVVIYHNKKCKHDLKNSTHVHKELNLKDPLGTYGFDIILFDSGHFHRKGDGGWMNWAFGGKFTREDADDVTFHDIDLPDDPPPGPPEPLFPQVPTRRKKKTSMWKVKGADGKEEMWRVVEDGQTKSIWKILQDGEKPPTKRDMNVFEDGEEMPARRGMDIAEDGNYFVNCKAHDGTVSSGVAYYKNLVPGKMGGQKPDDYVEVSRVSVVEWETTSSVHFPNRNVTVSWSILGDSEQAARDEACGAASTQHENFWLYRSPDEFMFEQDGSKCQSMYWGF